MARESTKDLKKNLVAAKKAAEALLNVWDNLGDAIVKSGKDIEKAFEGLDLGDSKDIAQLNKLLEETNKLTEQQAKINKEATIVEKEKIKIDRELAALEKDKVKTIKEQETLKQTQIKTEILLRKEKERQLKIQEKEQKALKLSNSAYAKQSKRLNDLRKTFKDLRVEQGKSTKESRKLLKEITKLDKELKDIDESAGQFQRSVGEYPDTLGDALSSVKGFAAALVGLGGSFAAVKTGLESTQEGSEDLRKTTTALESTWETTKNVFGTAAIEAFDLGKKLFKNSQDVDGLSDAVDNVAGSFTKTGEKIRTYTDDVEKNATAAVAAEEQTIDLEKALRSITPEVARLSAEIDKQNAIAGDSTRGFDEIETAAEAAQVATVKRARLNISVAQEELDIIQQQIAARSEGAAKADLLDKQAEAEVKLIEERNNLVVEQLELDKVLRENDRDRFERQLDFAIDAFDTIKTVNERIIADETVSVDARRALFEETVILTDKSFKEQKKLIEEFTGDKLNFDELVLESDEKVIRESLAKADLDDVTFGRALEIVRERKLAQQDLIESNRDLTLSEIETQEVRENVIDQEAELLRLRSTSGGTLEEQLAAQDAFEKELAKNRLAAIDAELETVAEGSKREIELIQEKNDILLSNEEIRIEKENDLVAEGLAAKEELYDKSVEVIQATFDKFFDKRNEQIDKDLSANQEAQDKIQSGIDAGNEDARKSLALKEKEEAELLAKQERLKKQELRVEAGIAIFKGYAENGGDIGKTVADTAVLTALISGLSFFHGTDKTPDDVLFADKHGGVTGFVHKDEQVWSAKDVSAGGNRTRAETIDILQMYDRDLITDPKQAMYMVQSDNSKLEKQVAEMTKSIKTLHERMPRQSSNYNGKTKEYEDQIDSHNKKELIRSKANVFA